MQKKRKIEFRVTPLERAIIEKKAENSGLNLSEFCRQSAMQKHVKFRLTSDEIEVYKTLTQFHNNFIHIGNLFRKKDSRFAKEIKQTAEEIKKHLNKLN